MIRCDNCQEGNKGRYKTFSLEVEDADGNIEKKLVTWCYDCIGTPAPTGKSDKQMWEHISTPFWVHAGLSPKKKELAQMRYMKDHNLSWGDLRKARYAKVPMTNEGVKTFEQHRAKYGRRNAPDASFGKKSP